MKNNFNKLNLFEALTVVMIVIGALIILVTLFAGLSDKHQKIISSSFELFDIHENLDDALEVPLFVLETSDKYMDEFYLAFTKVAIIPETHIEQVKNSVEKVLAYADTLATDYQRMTNHQEEGRVAGISISIQEDDNCKPENQGLFCRMIHLSDPVDVNEQDRLNVFSTPIQNEADCKPQQQGLLCRLIMLIDH